MNHYKYLTYDEVKSLRQEDGAIADVTITSIKTWKRRPDIQVNWKFGLRIFGSDTCYINVPQDFFVKRID